MSIRSRLHRVFRATEEENRQALLAALPRTCNGPLLDIGPHEGDLTIAAARHVGAEEIYGVELIGDHVPIARSKGIKVVQGDVDEGLPFDDGMFGYVFANQVIEHVRRTDVFLREIRRVLRPDGIAMISTNNLASWHNVISLALGFQPTPMHVSDEIILGNPMNPEAGLAHEDLGRTHLRLFTARALVELAAYHGLEAVHTETVGYYPLPPKLARRVVKHDQRHGAFTVAVFRPAEPQESVVGDTGDGVVAPLPLGATSTDDAAPSTADAPAASTENDARTA